MSDIKWTKEQEAAIYDRGGQLLISAAAGSGKTAVLVERAVSLLCDAQNPVPADSLLIVTFTNAAAAEMRSRIADRLAQMTRQNPNSSLLRRQQMLLQRASICTIDAFCLKLLQKNFSALDIPPDFTHGDDATCYELRRQALAPVLEEAYQDEDFRAFADLYGRGRSDTQTERILMEAYQFLRSLPYPMQVMDRLCDQWQQQTPFAETVWAEALMKTARRALESALVLARKAIDTAREEPAVEAAYLPALQSDLDALGEMLAAVEEGTWDDVYQQVCAFKAQPLGRMKKGEGDLGIPAKELRQMVKDIIEELQKNVLICTGAEFEEDRERIAPMVRAIAKVLKEFDQRYFAAKIEQKVLEFSDFEHLSLSLLRTPEGQRTALADQISRGFSVVMVDEYQDTNALQDALYSSLAKPDGSNLFFVGDLKQSIYRFRQADPTVFLEKQDSFAPLGSGYPAQIALDRNFRSAPGVIDGINYLFEKLMDRDLGGVEYGPGQKLVAGDPDKRGDYEGGVEIQVLRGASGAGDADYIARRIQTMVQQGFPVRRKDGTTRPAEYGDFCILLRVRSHFDAYAAALEARGIPVYADTSDNLLDAPHIRPLIALMRVLDNPAQDVPLAAVMVSPLYGFLPDDLVHLRGAFRQGSLYGAVASAHAAVQQGGPEAAEFAKVSAFYENLAELRRLARTLPAQQLLEQILADTGYLAAVGTLENGARRREDVRAFSEYASSAAGRGGIPGLVRALDAAENTGGLVSGGVGQTQEGCVSIMTDHRSKGLEFPVVFVADTGHKFNIQELSRPVLFHAKMGIGMMLRGAGGTYPTAAHRAVRSVMHDEMLSEEMRVLYVALTRARDRLIIIIPAEDPGSTLQKLAPSLAGAQPDRYVLSHAQSTARWLLAAAACHPGAHALREEAGMALPFDPDAPPIEIGVQDADEPQAGPDQSDGLPEDAPDEALLAQLKQKFRWKYPNNALVEVPAKVSVTAVVHQKEEPTLERPGFLHAQGLTAAEKGTALHAFLQFADFDHAPADLAAEARRQMEKGLLAPELADKLDYAALQKFFDGETFAHIRTAQQVLREYDFITALPAGIAMQDPDGDYGDARVLVQGIADIVLVWEDHAEILDYKTDRSKTPDQLRAAYAPQLKLYADAIEKRLDQPVTRCTLYSFALGCEVDVS